jgi:integrase
LGAEILRQNVLALRAVKRRRLEGEPIPTPKLPDFTPRATENGETLRAAFAGWQKDRRPAPGTLTEYERAIELFIQLHGNLPVSAITRTHARTFREALQDIPRIRTGRQLKQSLPELAQWGREHPDAPRLSAGTINKIIGGVQAVSVWAHDHGIIPDNLAWHDPFGRMRLEEDDPEREPFTADELRTLFASPVFTRGKRPKGCQGEAAFWLPVLGLFTGARRGELAALTVEDVGPIENTKHIAFTFKADKKRGKTVKTKSSARIVPLHPELKRLGLLEFVAAVKRERGASAWLFPGISPDCNGGAKAWTKWFGRYLAKVRIKGDSNTDKVFHSFRHTFKDALRQAGVAEDINDALTGHSARTVGRDYGAKKMLRRFGAKALASAVSRVKYKGLDLSDLSTVHSTGKQRELNPS